MASLTTKVFDELLVGGLDRVLPSHCRMTRLPFSGRPTRVRAHLSVLYRRCSGMKDSSLLYLLFFFYRLLAYRFRLFYCSSL